MILDGSRFCRELPEAGSIPKSLQGHQQELFFPFYSRTDLLGQCTD